MAASNNSIECLIILISYGADVNIEDVVSKYNNMNL